jgi:hypothetical protein
MENVEGLMQNMKLSAAENKGLKIRWTDGSKIGEVEAEALGKLLSEKPPFVDGMVKALGRIWCPLKGIRCKEMGNNVFLFTFLQLSGKNKVLNDGPWTFDKELLVLQKFDPTKSLEEYEFDEIPIWIRVFKLPLGMMYREIGEQIGEEVGEFIEVAVGEDGLAVGEFLRVHIRMYIKKPLLRGITINIGENMLPKWCPFEYEYLPDFCFTCGLLGHVDRSCSIKLKKGEQQQYGKWLKAAIHKKDETSGAQRWVEDASFGGNRRGPGFGFSGRSRGSGSDSDSWRKNLSDKRMGEVCLIRQTRNLRLRVR